jgi:hypothetical protein
VNRNPYGRWGLRFCVGLFAVVAAGMFIAAATAIFEQPRIYRSLADHGVPTLASAHCGGDGCELTYTFAGRRHTNDYGHDLSQFCRCPAATPVLVDPDDPATMFTVHDVEHGTNAGIGVYSVAVIGIGLFLAGLAALFFLTLRRLPSAPPPLEPLAPDASPLARSLDAIDDVQALLDQAYPLLGPAWNPAWYRVDRNRLTAGVEELRRRIAELPGPRAQALHVADRLAGEVRAAPGIPLIGGARVRAFDLSEQLDEVRLAIVTAARSR